MAELCESAVRQAFELTSPVNVDIMDELTDCPEPATLLPLRVGCVNSSIREADVLSRICLNVC